MNPKLSVHLRCSARPPFLGYELALSKGVDVCGAVELSDDMRQDVGIEGATLTRVVFGRGRHVCCGGER